MFETHVGLERMPSKRVLDLRRSRSQLFVKIAGEVLRGLDSNCVGVLILIALRGLDSNCVEGTNKV